VTFQSLCTLPPICDSALRDIHVVLDRAWLMCRCLKVYVCIRCNTLQHTSAHNRLFHIVTHFKIHICCPTEHGWCVGAPRRACAFSTTHHNQTISYEVLKATSFKSKVCVCIHCNTLQHTATHCSTLQNTHMVLDTARLMCQQKPATR